MELFFNGACDIVTFLEDNLNLSRTSPEPLDHLYGLLNGGFMCKSDIMQRKFYYFFLRVLNIIIFANNKKC